MVSGGGAGGDDRELQMVVVGSNNNIIRNVLVVSLSYLLLEVYVQTLSRKMKRVLNNHLTNLSGNFKNE